MLHENFQKTLQLGIQRNICSFNPPCAHLHSSRAILQRVPDHEESAIIATPFLLPAKFATVSTLSGVMQPKFFIGPHLVQISEDRIDAGSSALLHDLDGVIP